MGAEERGDRVETTVQLRMELEKGLKKKDFC